MQAARCLLLAVFLSVTSARVLQEADADGHANQIIWLTGAHGEPKHPHTVARPSHQEEEPDLSIYSALFDKSTNELQVFVEAAPHVPDSAITGCRLSPLAELGSDRSPTELPAVVSMMWGHNASSWIWRPLKVSCAQAPEWASAAQLSLGYRLKFNDNLHTAPVHGQIQVEAIGQHHETDIGACVGPLFSATPFLQDWLIRNAILGVRSFYLYVPHADFIDHEQYSRGEQANFPGHHLRVKHRVQPFHSSTVSWLHYVPHHASHYFGQQTLYNDCVYRNRHKHKYLLVMDTDEFVTLADGTLLELLDRHLPGKYASAMLPMEWYNVHCSRTLGTYRGMNVFAPENMRPDPGHFKADDDRYSGAKSIVQPAVVDLMHPHNPLAASLPAVAHISETEAVLKHVRCSFWE